MAYRIRPRIVLQPFLGRIFEHHFAITAADLAAKRCGPRVASVQPSADRHKATARPADDKRPAHAHDLAQLKERMQAIRVWAGRGRAHSSCAVPLLHRIDDSGTPRAAAGSPSAGGTGLATRNWQPTVTTAGDRLALLREIVYLDACRSPSPLRDQKSSTTMANADRHTATTVEPLQIS